MAAVVPETVVQIVVPPASAIQPGDIVLASGLGLSDRLIQFGTKSHWNHVAVVETVAAEDVTILEMQSAGCRRSSLSRTAPGWSFRDVGKTPEERADGLRWARRVFDRQTRYGWLDILIIALRIVIPFWSVTLADGRMFCSQFVVGFLDHAGDCTFDTGAFVSPGDIDKAFPAVVS